MKKSRFLILFGSLVLVGALLSGCAGQVIATGASGLTIYAERAYLASGAYVYSVDVANGTENTTTDSKGNSVPIRFPAASRNIAFGSAPAAVSPDQMVVGNAFSNDRKHQFFSFNPKTMAYSEAPWPYLGAKDLWMGSPLVIDGLIYAPNSDGGLYVFGPDATLKGKFQTGGSLWATPVYDGKLLYVSSLDHSLYAVDPADLSKAVWQQKLDSSIVSAPLLLDGKLYVGTINNSLYALDAPTGKIIWHQMLDGGIWSSPASASLAANSAAAPSPTASSAATASPTPTATPTTSAAPSATPGATIYVGTAKNPSGGTLYAINAADGSTQWTFTSAGGIGASPVVQEGRIFFVDEDGMIQALTSEGKSDWQKQLAGSKFYTAPVLTGDLLLVAPTNNKDFVLAAYSLDGAQKWTFSPNKK